jgi:hypothetical protein
MMLSLALEVVSGLARVEAGIMLPFGAGVKYTRTVLVVFSTNVVGMMDVAVPFAIRRVVKTVCVDVPVLKLETVATIEVEMLKLDELTLAAFPFPTFPVPYGMEYVEEGRLVLDVASALTSTLLDVGLPFSKLGYTLVALLRLKWG